MVFHDANQVAYELFVIGLLGGIGAGKSTVAALFKKYNVQIVNADEITHNVLNYPQIQEQITSLWGKRLLKDGKIDRRTLAAIVFNQEIPPTPEHPLKQLEKILHPVVRSEIRGMLKTVASAGQKIAVLDVPLLWEGGLYKECDILVFVDTPAAVRQERLSSSRQWSVAELQLREKFQTDVMVKKAHAHYVINNGNNQEETERQIQTIWNSIVQHKIFQSRRDASQ